jgi:hypothetical protein
MTYNLSFSLEDDGQSLVIIQQSAYILIISKRAGKNTVMSDKCGKAAVYFELPDADGVMHSLSDYRGNWLLLVFHRHFG